MNSKVLIGIVLVIIILGGGYFAAKSMKHAMAPVPSIPSTTPSSISSAPTEPTTSPAMAGQQITVTGSEFAFSPSTITVKKGQPVTLTFKNAGQYPHNFTVSELNIQTKTIQPGQEDTITFTPTTTGSFTYICTVPGHADRGMKGTLTVE